MREASVSGPLPGSATTAFVGYDLGEVGYLEEEYFLSGEAQSYELAGERRADGRWSVTPGALATYTTRVVVRRPIDPARFNGTLLVEWLNVSGGTDAEADWAAMHRYIHREGIAWIGVSAQRAGIEGGGLIEGFHIKALSPERYSGLSHPGDAYSYDMFTQAARVSRLPGTILGPLVVDRVIASGHSQSAAFLVTYINAVDPRERAFDGFFVHGRGASAANMDSWGLLPPPGEPATGEPATGEPAPARPASADLRAARAVMQSRPVLIREDHRVPVMVFQTETDVVKLASARARQDDGPLLRLWELAGASHADTYLLAASRLDSGSLGAQRLAELLAPSGEETGLSSGSPVNSGPQQHYVGQAALMALERWIRNGTPPPCAPRFELKAEGSEELAVDDLGIARGGIRTPWVDVPSCVLSGISDDETNVFGFLLGTTRPIAAQTLDRMYPGGREEYIKRFTASLDEVVAAGFLLAEDVPEILAVAELSSPL